MKVVNIHEAKTHLSRLVEEARQGHPFVIAKAGKPMVTVTPIEAPARRSRLGFMEGELIIPEDFDEMMADEIRTMFEDGE